MKKLLAACLLCSATWVTLGQGRATMSSPVIRTSKEVVFMIVKFSDFQPGNSYRIGLGGNGADFNGAEIELTVGEQAGSSTLSNFEQGNTSGWWGVDSIQVRGYQLGDSVAPDQELQMNIKLPLALAQQAGKIYLFVSRKYGENLWYLEDGIELTGQHW